MAFTAADETGHGRKDNDDFAGVQAGSHRIGKEANATADGAGDLSTGHGGERGPRRRGQGGNLLARWTRQFGAEAALEVGPLDRSEHGGGFFLQLDNVDLDIQHSLTSDGGTPSCSGGPRTGTTASISNPASPRSLSERIASATCRRTSRAARHLTLTLGLKLKRNRAPAGVAAQRAAGGRPTETTLVWGAVSRRCATARVERDLVFTAW